MKEQIGGKTRPSQLQRRPSRETQGNRGNYRQIPEEAAGNFGHVSLFYKTNYLGHPGKTSETFIVAMETNNILNVQDGVLSVQRFLIAV